MPVNKIKKNKKSHYPICLGIWVVLTAPQEGEATHIQFLVVMTLHGFLFSGIV